MIKRKWKKTGAKHAATLFLLAAACALTVLACLCAYQYDNKYTASSPQASRGVLRLDDRALTEYPVRMLVEGWEYYGGRLLAPEDFAAGALLPDEYLYIGQYGGFEGGDSAASPHGSATYRLVIELPEEPRAYTLELPEIFSAYRVYINGNPAAAMGNPDPERYRPQTLNRTVSFEAEGRIEIIIAVSDFSHLYSGMVYPPAFGLPDAVSRLLSARFLFRAALCAAALTIGLLSVLIGILSHRNMRALLYGLLCLFFVGYTAYPILKTFFSGYYPYYALENVSFCAMLAVVMLLQRRICGLKDKWSLAFPLFGVLTCAASVMLHLSLPGGKLHIIHAYSWLITACEWITAGYLTVTAIRAVWENAVHSTPILIGIIMFDTALMMDRLLPLHEPIVTGWFPELASFVLVLSVGAVTGKELAEQYTQNAVLSERAGNLNRLLQMQKAYYIVLEEKMREAKTMRHDMRHHFTMIDGLIRNKQYDELKDYVTGYRADDRESGQEDYCPNNILNVLANHFAHIAEQNRIHFDLRHDMEGGEIQVADADLCGLFCNLLENAVESCLRVETGERFIQVAIVGMGSMLTIRVWNSTDGNVRQSGDGFLSSKEDGKGGFGLYSIRTIAEKYGGMVTLDWDRAERTFDSMVSLEMPRR